MPIVSVVITTLNRHGYLREAIQSALAQTFTDFEILVSDDGACAETRRLCESFDDRRIRHIVNDAALGIAMNTYSGITHAAADLIALLNDDDRWTPDFLARCLRPLLDDSRVVLTFSDHWLIDSDGRRMVRETDRYTSLYGRDTLQAGYVKEPLKLLTGNSIPLAMASIFRKSAIDWSLYSDKVGGAYDYFLSYCLLRSGGTIVYVPERLTEYRAHDSSASAKFNLINTLGSCYINETILHDPIFSPIKKDILAKTIGIEQHLAKLYLQQRDVVSTVIHLVKAIRYRVC
jgi:glycosyltransferase involved in cell wall biosynthesis